MLVLDPPLVGTAGARQEKDGMIRKLQEKIIRVGTKRNSVQPLDGEEAAKGSKSPKKGRKPPPPAPSKPKPGTNP
eukprot:3023809-Pyramimonas_sp.AAC.1